MVKNPPAHAGDARDVGAIPGLGRSPGERKWQPTSAFLQKIPWTKEPGQATVHGVAKSGT